ncbi:MAG: LptF/LptG family permease [Candidatus Bipolaricaulota bacterium]|nr:LptF/LptG family permease [Candidatus Bipolaricaulota bacterium]
MLRRCDRYILREALGPFLLALAGLVLFILLNVILSLSDLMVDRGVSMTTLLRLVLLKIPSLLVVAVPMSALFATFLGLGRMGHDREVLALESLGIPLRRILLPLLLAAAFVGVADFALYNWLVPASEAAYQDALRQVIYRQGTPRITPNAFFKGQNDQFFYIRRFDESSGKLYDVVIYDTTGRLFPQAGTQVTMITADEGTWTAGAWTLSSGTVYGFDREGQLVFTATIESLVIPIEQGVAELVSHSRTPSEMGLAELRERITQARKNGQRVHEYIVESHLKLALPLATLVFVLLGGALSLAFLPANRAVGIVLGLLLVAVFQGFLWWTQTLGRRGAMDPAWAAWLPDLVFGVIGVYLYARVDRLATRDTRGRWWRRLPLTLILLLAVSLSVLGTDAFGPSVDSDAPEDGIGSGVREDNVGSVPVHLECDELFVADDGSTLHAVGSVRATFADSQLEADDLLVERVQSSSWRLSASGSVALLVPGTTELAGDSMIVEINGQSGEVRPRWAEADGLRGEVVFTNSEGKEKELFFRARRGEVSFDDKGEVSLLTAEQAEVTTCDCCGLALDRQPYSLKADRLRLYPDRLLVAYGLTARVSAVRVFWLPLYVQPLEETLDSPLFPAFGSSSSRGWFVKWNVPFFLSEAVYGTILLDYYSKYSEIGVGATLRYAAGGHEGRASAYILPSEVNDTKVEVSATDTVTLGANWQGVGRLEYKMDGDDEELSFSAKLRGTIGRADVSLLVSRIIDTTTTTTIEEKLPELSFSLPSQEVGPLSFRPTFFAGWYREEKEGESPEGRFRFRSQLESTVDAMTFAGFRIQPSATLQTSLYADAIGWEDVESIEVGASATRSGLELTWTTTFARGSSPFEFDETTTEHELTWTTKRSGPVDLTISGSFNSVDGPGLVRATADWDDWATWKVTANYNLTLARLSTLVVRGNWRDEHRKVAWRIPYDALDGEFSTASLDVSTQWKALSLSLENDLNLNTLALTAADITADLAVGNGWGLELEIDYSSNSFDLGDVSYGVFKDIADCVRVGIERSSGDVWLYVSILAFPEAVLRYAPTSASFEIGE